ncbi:hypothetical protein LCGC14_1441230 [marine sediment metagenome]|uniref:HD/PDEase domain-containing protein n=1 Tax=marine sediment metagenome TaxID=412755 RepID=A0A0F9JL95_9ZZZZ
MSAIREVLYGEFRRVSYVYRYSALPVLNRENVAEHSWWTAIIGMTIACEIGRQELMNEVAARGLLHDIEEIGTGDLVREAKYFDQKMRDDFRRVEEAFASRLFGKLGTTGSQLWLTWTQAKDDSLAGQIVALADLLCVIAYVRHERSIGNTRLDRVERECLSLIDEKFGDNKLLLPIVAEATRKGT